MTQLFFITRRRAISNIRSVEPQVKVTLEGQFFVPTIGPKILDGFQYNLHDCSPSRVDIPFVQVGPRSILKVKVTCARHVVHGQPSSSSYD